MTVNAIIPQKHRIAVFASGFGSNLQALFDYQTQKTDWPATVALVVSDKPQCHAIERALAAGVPVFAVNPKTYQDKAHYEADVLGQLKHHEIKWVALAGYMRLVGPTLLGAYPGRIINIHPSLLPAFPGKSAIDDAFAAGVDVTGVTVHVVDEGMDTGPILAQQAVPVEPGMTKEALEQAIHRVEHQLYPTVIAQVVRG